MPFLRTFVKNSVSNPLSSTLINGFFCPSQCEEQKKLFFAPFVILDKDTPLCAAKGSENVSFSPFGAVLESERGAIVEHSIWFLSAPLAKHRKPFFQRGRQQAVGNAGENLSCPLRQKDKKPTLPCCASLLRAAFHQRDGLLHRQKSKAILLSFPSGGPCKIAAKGYAPCWWQREEALNAAKRQQKSVRRPAKVVVCFQRKAASILLLS